MGWGKVRRKPEPEPEPKRPEWQLRVTVYDNGRIDLMSNRERDTDEMIEMLEAALKGLRANPGIMWGPP